MTMLALLREAASRLTARRPPPWANLPTNDDLERRLNRIYGKP